MNTPLPQIHRSLRHPFETETFEERRARILAKVDALEWEARARWATEACLECDEEVWVSPEDCYRCGAVEPTRRLRAAG